MRDIVGNYLHALTSMTSLRSSLTTSYATVYYLTSWMGKKCVNRQFPIFICFLFSLHFVENNCFENCRRPDSNHKPLRIDIFPHTHG